MKLSEQIYNATNQGFDILRYYYPQITEDLLKPGKFFRLRDETAPSARIRLHKDIYRITDFGDDGREYTPIDIAMSFENVTYSEVLHILADRYGINNAKKAWTPQKIEKRDAKDDEPNGAYFLNERKLTDADCNIMGSKVTIEIMHKYGWIALDSYTSIKDGTAITKYASDTCPIYARKCIFVDANGNTDFFYKVYNPKSTEKQYRFTYLPSGKKPKDYINGMHELSKACEINEESDGEKPKLAATLCSGERDALCVAARGGYPLWLNSETAQLSKDCYDKIKKYADVIFNIPDIDETGVKQGTALACKYMDIYTIWLPTSIQRYKDWRGNPYKDFRDYCELYPSWANYVNLQRMAMQAKFWRYNAKSGSYFIDLESLYYFVRMHGFFVYIDKYSEQLSYMRQQGQIVSEVKARDIKYFLRDWSRDNFIDKDVRNLILGSKINDTIWDALDAKHLDIRNFAKDYQYLFFKNTSVKVTSDAITPSPKDDVICYDYNVINKDINILQPMFEVNEDATEIKIIDTSSKYFCYLINSSRIYWREELETFADDLGDLADDYRLAHKFSITADCLTDEQNAEQVACLLSKMYAIGYYLHGYKSPSDALAVYAMDWLLGERGENNGRSGKSFFFSFADHFLRMLKLSGRNKKLMDNNHVYDQITRQTELVLIDDCNERISPDMFYDNITSDLTVNPKNQSSYTIKFDDAPKFGFTTNYVPNKFDPSTVGRLHFLVFSDYYHIQADTNKYRENRQIFDDFGKNLYKDYNDLEFNADYNFWLQCLQLYLKLSKERIRPTAKLDNIIKRSQKAQISDSFGDWATAYFDAGGTHVNKLLDRQQTYNICKAETGNNSLTSKRFMTQLKNFVALSDTLAEVNPKDICGSNGRIIKTINGESREMIYVKSK